MSVLMKALANAAKDKQGRQAAEARAVALAAMDTLATAANISVTAAEDSKPPELCLLELSLAEESGLGLAALSSAGRREAKQETPPHAALVPNAARPSGASSADQAAAAKAFVKHPPVASSKSALIGLALAASLLLGLAVQGFIYMRDLSAADSVQLTPALSAAATDADALVAMPAHAPIPVAEAETAIAEHRSRNNAVAELADTDAETDAATASTPGISAQADSEKLSPQAGNEVAIVAATASPADLTRSHRLLQLRSKKPLAAVDPGLLAAYQAFNRGEDNAAQQQYRQLLQHDVRNVDALFGMAAIAQRQGRDADAVGWYQTLLAIEPNNMHAQSALLSLQPSTDAVATGSRIKSMLVQQPETASLHAALGNIYAAQNQWAAAQQAYFSASQFAPENADYAFNLAISLDQLGKSKLALAQYQRSLDLINSSSSLDRAQLEARMQALQ